MNIKIIAVGKIKEKFHKEAIDELLKRLTGYCSISVTEVQAEQIQDDTYIEKYKDLEAERILSYIKSDSYVITLEIGGRMYNSEEFAAKLKEIGNNGTSEIIFIIGGANGLSSKVSNIANLKLSFSKMTFTHQIIRLVLAEQIYRAFKINNNEKYHR